MVEVAALAATASRPAPPPCGAPGGDGDVLAVHINSLFQSRAEGGDMSPLCVTAKVVRDFRFESKADIGTSRMMSAIPPKADMAERDKDVRFVPKDGVVGRRLVDSCKIFGCCASG
jgi:hypothetical protein